MPAARWTVKEVQGDGGGMVVLTRFQDIRACAHTAKVSLLSIVEPYRLTSCPQGHATAKFAIPVTVAVFDVDPVIYAQIRVPPKRFASPIALQTVSAAAVRCSKAPGRTDRGTR